MIYLTRQEKGYRREYYRAVTKTRGAYPRVFGYFSPWICRDVKELIKDGFKIISEEEFNKYMLIEKMKK
jgi:hypothetical protein